MQVLTNYELRPEPSAWVARFAAEISPGGRVLDLAAGNGRHTRLLRGLGHPVVAADRDTAGIADLAGDPGCSIRKVDLETGEPWPLGGDYAGIVVANYLHRPLFPALVGALAVGGIVIYRPSPPATAGSASRAIRNSCCVPASCWKRSAG